MRRRGLWRIVPLCSSLCSEAHVRDPYIKEAYVDTSTNSVIVRYEILGAIAKSNFSMVWSTHSASLKTSLPLWRTSKSRPTTLTALVVSPSVGAASAHETRVETISIKDRKCIACFGDGSFKILSSKIQGLVKSLEGSARSSFTYAWNTQQQIHFGNSRPNRYNSTVCLITRDDNVDDMTPVM